MTPAQRQATLEVALNAIKKLIAVDHDRELPAPSHLMAAMNSVVDQLLLEGFEKPLKVASEYTPFARKISGDLPTNEQIEVAAQIWTAR